MPFGLARLEGIRINVPPSMIDRDIRTHVIKEARTLFRGQFVRNMYVVDVVKVNFLPDAPSGPTASPPQRDDPCTEGKIAASIPLITASADFVVSLDLLACTVYKGEHVVAMVGEVVPIGMFCSFGPVTIFCSRVNFSIEVLACHPNLCQGDYSEKLPANTAVRIHVVNVTGNGEAAVGTLLSILDPVDVAA